MKMTVTKQNNVSWNFFVKDIFYFILCTCIYASIMYLKNSFCFTSIKQVYRDLEILGWYTIGSELIIERHINVHYQICNITQCPIVLQLNAETGKTNVSLTLNRFFLMILMIFSTFFADSWHSDCKCARQTNNQVCQIAIHKYERLWDAQNPFHLYAPITQSTSTIRLLCIGLHIAPRKTNGNSIHKLIQYFRKFNRWFRERIEWLCPFTRGQPSTTAPIPLPYTVIDDSNSIQPPPPTTEHPIEIYDIVIGPTLLEPEPELEQHQHQRLDPDVVNAIREHITTLKPDETDAFFRTNMILL